MHHNERLYEIFLSWCILNDVAWPQCSQYSDIDPSLNPVCKLWSMIEIKVVVEVQCLSAEIWGSMLRMEQQFLSFQPVT
jgi:hypothetical protein